MQTFFPMSDLETDMLCCWHCNAPVKIVNMGFDWLCPVCGQGGEYMKIAKDHREGSYWNAPYKKEESPDGCPEPRRST
jgi:predicted RNA-binding Zn-ribbon protein involved in translation (DUF1610 family)